MRAEVIVRGIVQGVGFRPFIYRIASANRLVGYVRNRGDAGVEIVVEGEERELKRFLRDLKEKKPPLSQIFGISVNYPRVQSEFANFSIIKSFDGGGLSGSVIPYDVSICDRCLEELRDPSNRRHDYFFITCTECGPRYTVIESLPYDRQNTTMRSFSMCEECSNEYATPLDRRFHAQTIACRKCGPKVILTDRDGRNMAVDDPIREAGRLLEEGYIIAVKGNGGFHIASSTTQSKPLKMLRNIKHRAQKPFATMARSLEAVKTFAEVNTVEEKLITSSIRPIVLLKKNRSYYLSELISPRLHSVGVMLPYTGLHYMLFDGVEEPAFVMTSANAPSEPIVTDNEEAQNKLGKIVDYFLLHNRTIAQRCDDSVLRVNGGEKSILRRSRGFTPSPIHIKTFKRRSVLGLGAEENVTTCVLLGDKAFLSQHIGDVERFDTLQFLKRATRHLLEVTRGKIDAVACDLHPKFVTTQLAYEFAGELGCPVIQTQHHYSHMLSLMGEKGVDEAIGIVCDGAGYGLDGNTWGGEVLHCTLDGFRRLGHLQEQPLVGGDLATLYPLRMAIGILHKFVDTREWALSKFCHFPYGKREVNIVLKQIETGRTPMTTSCGRILDAVSALLGICYERTYEGEPALKLESTAFHGANVLRIEPKIDHGVVDTTHLMLEVFDNVGKYSSADLAYSAESYIAESLAELAVGEARKIGVDNIGFSGGVAYNEHLSSLIEKIVDGADLNFFIHDLVPPGDGGIAFGQAFGASSKR